MVSRIANTPLVLAYKRPGYLIISSVEFVLSNNDHRQSKLNAGKDEWLVVWAA